MTFSGNENENGKILLSIGHIPDFGGTFNLPELIYDDQSQGP